MNEPTPLKDNPYVIPLDWTRLSETPEELQAAEAKFTALDRFNRRVRKLYENDPKQFQESLDALHLPKDGLLPEDQPLLRAYAAADSMANHYHARINRLIRLMFILTGLLVLSYSTYSGIWGSPVALSAYVLCFLFGFACYMWEKCREIYTWFLDTRGLREEADICCHVVEELAPHYPVTGNLEPYRWECADHVRTEGETWQNQIPHVCAPAHRAGGRCRPCG